MSDRRTQWASAARVALAVARVVRVVARAAPLAVLLLVAACAGRSPSERPSARSVTPPVRDELDPLGFIVELRTELGLTEEQVTAVRGVRGRVRSMNRADFARLDSLDYALGGRLGPWLREARGGARPRRRWMPKLPPAQRDTFEQVLRAIRERGEAAECQAATRLTAEQRRTLARLDSLHHRTASRSRRQPRTTEVTPSGAPTVRGAGGSAAPCTDPLPAIGWPWPTGASSTQR